MENAPNKKVIKWLAIILTTIAFFFIGNFCYFVSTVFAKIIHKAWLADSSLFVLIIISVVIPVVIIDSFIKKSNLG